MNKFFTLFILSVLIAQSQVPTGILEEIKKNANSIKKAKNDPLEKQFLHAKSLERTGLYEEAIILYKEINNKNPGNSRYFQPMKKYLRQIESWDTLLVYTEKYVKARNEDFTSQLDLLDIYLWMEKESVWKQISFDLLENESLNNKSIKNVIRHLINNGKYDFAYERLIEYRKKIAKKDFFSMEMAMLFGMQMLFDKATMEYLLFLESHPNKFQTVSDRFMAYPDNPDIINTISAILLKSHLQTAQFILADLKFKQKQYEEGYNILILNKASSSMLLNYAKDLVSIKEFIYAEKVLADIITFKENDQIITEAVFEIAKIFELKMISNSLDLPLSGFYSHNSFFSSPYLPVKEPTGTTLEHAMVIYDSLRVSKKNAQAAYRLAEVQFHILGDLDGASYLYNEAHHHGNSRSLRTDAGLGIINVYISKGDLEGAEKKLLELREKTPETIKYDIKLAQIQFYKGNFDETDHQIREVLKNLSTENILYNDILNVLAILIAFRHNQEEFIEFSNVQLIIQQNKRMEAIEKLETLINTDEIYVSDMCRYQQAWLTFLQNDIETVKLQLQSINNDTIYKELALIFQSEILDYIDNNISKAIDSYLEFLELYPNSIYYDDIRLRLRELTS